MHPVQPVPPPNVVRADGLKFCPPRRINCELMSTKLMSFGAPRMQRELPEDVLASGVEQNEREAVGKIFAGSGV